MKRKWIEENKRVKDEYNALQLNSTDILNVWRGHYEKKCDMVKNYGEHARETMIWIQKQEEHTQK